jgi:lipid II:glycine glycyltransferase (peptidoglycan interpeptide bridge formation enzyme)
MEIKEIIDEKYRKVWNEAAKHPLQAWEWGEFREKTGVKVVRYGIFNPSTASGQATLVEPLQITIHKIPHTPWNVGYYPKGNEIVKEHLQALQDIAQKYNCIYVKCEPKIEVGIDTHWLTHNGFRTGRSLFTKYNFVLDVTKSEEELLAAMKQKTRYNIKVAQKRGVTVSLDDSPEAFARYLQLTKETTERQGFYAHGEKYHRKMWETLRRASESANRRISPLTADILAARYNGEIITTWVLFQFGDTLYYPYGASTRDHRDVMANNLVMWEAIKIAKERGLHYLDMWGALGPDADPADPWYGFHTFKQGYGARHVEYIGTWDYVAMPLLYYPLAAADWVRWKLLRIIKH